MTWRRLTYSQRSRLRFDGKKKANPLGKGYVGSAYGNHAHFTGSHYEWGSNEMTSWSIILQAATIIVLGGIQLELRLLRKSIEGKK
jgi:hypothetical protein